MENCSQRLPIKATLWFGRADHYGTAFIEFTINGVPELRRDADDIAVLLNGGPAKKREAFSRIFKQEQAFVDSILKAGMKLPRVAG